MEDFIEVPKGELRSRPKSHIRGEEKSQVHDVRRFEKSEAAKHEEKKTEEFRRQDVGGALEEIKPGAKDVEWESPDKDQTEESYDWKADLKGEDEEEVTEEPVESLRQDLEGRNQPEPGHYKSSNQKGPKHWRT